MFKPELVLPPLLTAVVLIGVILYSMRRTIRDSDRLSLELNAKAQGRVDHLLAKHQTELARMEVDTAARAAAEAAGFDLVLTLDAGADADEVFVRVVEMLDELDEFARASGGTGLKLDTKQSNAEPGTVTLRLVPADKPHDVAKQREVVMARSRKIAGVSEVELVTARSRKLADVSEAELVAA